MNDDILSDLSFKPVEGNSYTYKNSTPLPPCTVTHSGEFEALPRGLLTTHNYRVSVRTDIAGKYKNETRWAVRDDTGRHVAEFYREEEAQSYVALHNAVSAP